MSGPSETFELQDPMAAVIDFSWHHQTLQREWKHQPGRYRDKASFCTKIEITDGRVRALQRNTGALEGSDDPGKVFIKRYNVRALLRAWVY